jgi:hypothetical protein
MDRFSVSLTLAGAIVTVAAEGFAMRAGVPGWRDRLPYYLAAVIMAGVSISGLHSVEYRSMIRYSLPIFAMWVIGVSGLADAWARRTPAVSYFIVATSISFILFSVFLQAQMARTFMRGGWVG